MPKVTIPRGDLIAVEPLEGRTYLAVSLELSGTQVMSPSALTYANNNNVPEPTARQSEVNVAVNPLDPLKVAGVSYRFVGLTNAGLDFAYSMDGGASWSRTTIDNSIDQLGNATRYDPIIAYADDGRLFVAYGFAGTGEAGIAVLRSQDFGQTFDHLEKVGAGPTGVDKPMFATGVDPTTGNPALYIAYISTAQGQEHVRVAGCNNLGAAPLSFEFDRNVAISSVNPGFGTPSVAVGPSGQVYVTWSEFADQTEDDYIHFDKDVDGLWGTGDSFDGGQPIRQIVNEIMLGSNAPEPNPSNAQVHAQPQRGIITNPIVAADRRSGGGGRLYITFLEWNEPRVFPNPTMDSNVKFGYSTDGGENWTFSTLDSSTGTEFNPWPDVDQATGSVNVLYYTTDGDQGGTNSLVKMRFAQSINGGANWTLQDVTTITSNEHEPFGNPTDFPFDYLEYIGLDVHQGTAHGLFAFEPFGPGADSLDLDALYLNVASASTGNTLTVSGDDNPLAPSDSVVLRRHPDNASYLQVLVNNVQQFAGRIDTIGQLLVNLGAGDDTIYVYDDFPFSLSINGGAGSDSIIIEGGSATNEVALDAGMEMELLLVNADNQGDARVVLANSQLFGQLTIGTGGGVRMVQDGSLLLRAEAISIASGGFLDLADNDMIVDAVSYAGVEALLVSGYNGGQWNGSGIHSSSARDNPGTRALGNALASDLFTTFPATWAGQSVSSNAVLIRYTFYGDADLDTAVNLQDFNRLAGNFGQSSRRWVHGDFNYNGIVNLADFNLLAANFGSSDGPDPGEYYTYEELEKMLEEYQ